MGDGTRVKGSGEARFIEEMVKPAIEAAKTQYPDINVEPLALYDNGKGFVVPGSFFKVGEVDYTQELDDKVFINAWDPWSALGNGNFLDDTADGWWGRSTAISLLGWPMSNRKMEFVDASEEASAAAAASTAASASAAAASAAAAASTDP